MALNDNPADHPGVMVSSTYSDLIEHRKAVAEALLRLGFFPVNMESTSAKTGKDKISASLEMVAGAQAYIGLLSHRYGSIPNDPKRNPDKLSITELEYREALSRGIPVFIFMMSKSHPITIDDVETDQTNREKLAALKKDAESRSIYAEFSSVEELSKLVLQSMAEHKEELIKAKQKEQSAKSSDETKSESEQPRRRDEKEIPQPPNLFAVPSYISGHEFVGRRAELHWLDDWVKSNDSLMIIEAIGGTGKSALTWQWIEDRARKVRPGLAGVMWYSFYEGGADMSAFAAYALAYMTGEPLKEFRGRKTSDLARLLIAVLQSRPFLIVLDGLERVLVAYNRLDAAQARDDQVDSDKDHRACIKPSDEELLRQLVAVDPSKILITSRLLPTALINKSGQPLHGARHRRLEGLHPDDALRMFRAMDVRGNEESIRRYLSDNFENHPLVVGIVAGLVRNYYREPGNFDRWADDPQAGASLHLSKMDIKQRRTHILEAALNGLEPGARQLLSRIAAIGRAVLFKIVEVLNPFRLLDNEEGERSKVDGEAMAKLIAALQELQRRGLLQWDRCKNRYDLHPVVRGYAFDVLEQGEREGICNLIVDYFQNSPADIYAEAKTLEDIQQSIDIFRLLIQARRFDEAVAFYNGEFALVLLFSLEAHYEILAMMKPLFSDGYQSKPPMIMSKYGQGYLFNEVANALDNLSRYSEAQEAYAAALSLYLESDSLIEAWAVLCNLAGSYYPARQTYLSISASELALELAEALEKSDHVARSHLALMFICSQTGQFERAEAEYEAFRQFPLPTSRALYRPGYAEVQYCWLSFFQGRLTIEELDDAENLARSGNRQTIRELASLRGELSLQRGQIEEAITAFEKVVEMRQAVRLSVSEEETRLALAKAISGEREQARQICDRLREMRKSPHTELAEAYLEIGDLERAKYHALEGYKKAWGEGPPYSLWWSLERCRTVLKKLGEPEPVLLAFDPKTAKPLPFEAEVRKAIAKLKEEREEEES